METKEQFHARVRAMTGCVYEDIQPEYVGDGDGGLPGAIVCKRGAVYVCAVGYPDDVDEDGVERWDAVPANFRRCILHQAQFAEEANAWRQMWLRRASLDSAAEKLCGSGVPIEDLISVLDVLGELLVALNGLGKSCRDAQGALCGVRHRLRSAGPQG